MKKIYFIGIMFLIIDSLLGLYIFDKGGTDAAIKSGFVGNISVFIIFMSVAMYFPVLFWSLAEKKK